MGSNPSYFKNGADYPVEQVSWNDAQEFIRRLNGQGSARFRLPTEAEWEYACRSGGKEETYAGGESVGSVAWYDGNAGGQTHAVGTKAPNGLGLYDMSGDVWEWVEDIYNDSAYQRHTRNNPVNTGGGSGRVFRGGAWYFVAGYARCAYRGDGDPGGRRRTLGFRLLRTD
jgi:formylglycine-generating enzyme required for sulfatase activity